MARKIWKHALPGDIACCHGPGIKALNCCVPEYVQKLKDGLENAYCLVRERCEAEHKRQKSIYDEKVHGPR